tara:strand:+ start:634 stop:888 length:255 start_codon:yes stop_codon:yes gene_type:complete
MMAKKSKQKGLDSVYESNIFSESEKLKYWANDLADACGSVLLNKKPNISKADKLIEVFVNHYNVKMEAVAEELDISSDAKRTEV